MDSAATAQRSGAAKKIFIQAQLPQFLARQQTAALVGGVLRPNLCLLPPVVIRLPMPFLVSAPSIYFDESEIRDLVAEFSERLRRDGRVRPALDRLVGNRWFEAEQNAEKFLAATLFMTDRPEVDRDFLLRAVEVLGHEEIDVLAEIMLDCALAAFPLQSAAAIAEVSEMLAETMSAVIAGEDRDRQQRLSKVYSRLSSGTLMGRF